MSRTPLDITGERYGRLVALRLSHRLDSISYWVCKCDCGATVTTLLTGLRSGGSKSCGCLKHEVIDISGERYGRLVAQHFAYRRNLQTFWVCKCDCGNSTTVPTNSLRSENTRSCGCLRRETSRINASAFNPSRFNIEIARQYRQDGLSFQAIATKLGVTKQAVHARLKRYTDISGIDIEDKAS